MDEEGRNYRHASIGALDGIQRETLHDKLALTGTEISLNQLPPGRSVPFLHSHKVNEEVYIFLKGRGSFLVDGEQFEVGEGSVVRVDPAGQRCIKAADDESLMYVCVQAGACSLTHYSMTDGTIPEEKPAWK